jgi:hypothetical protein
MEKATLILSLETLTHSERVRRMVEYGKLSKTDTAIQDLLQRLHAGSLYEQALSLESCYGSRDIAHAVTLLASPSQYLRKRAVNMIVLLGSDDDVVQALRAVPADLQVRTVRRMRNRVSQRRRRYQAIEMFLESLEGGGEEDENLFRTLLALGSRALVERHLPRLQDSLLEADWTRLGRYHPAVVQASLRQQAAAAAYNDVALVKLVEAQCIRWVCDDRVTDSLLELVQDLLPKIPINRFPIPKLVEKRPQETIRILLACESDLPEHVVSSLDIKTLRQLPIELFLPLFKRYPLVAPQYCFEKLLPEQRRVVYNEVRQGWRTEEGVLLPATVAALPKSERVQEARRHLRLKAFKAQPDRRIPYIAFLPWTEAVALQAPFIQDSDAEIRGLALKAQIAAAKWDESHLADALQLMLHHQNEADPVKREMVNGLSEIPIGRWETTHLADLSRVIGTVLNAGDTSSMTVCPLLNLVTDLLPRFPEWAKTQLATMTQRRGEMPRWQRPTGKVSTADTMALVADALSPLLKRLLAANDGDNLQRLGTGFGDQIKFWTEYLETCKKSLEVQEMSKWRQDMLEILKKHQPLSWAEAIPRLLGEKAEASGLPILLDHVHRREQPLLGDYYLHNPSWWTRAALGRLSGGFWRWTADQHAAFANLLLADIANQDKSETDKVKAIKQLGRLTHFVTQPLVEIANDSSHPMLQEAALRTLGCLDDDRGIQTLMESMGDERARIAIYALRKTLKTFSARETLALLQSVPQSKVSVAKETLSLIGGLKTESAYQHLLSTSQSDLHPDVRAALLSTLWPHLSRAEAWAIFTAAAVSPDVKIAKAAADIPRHIRHADHALLLQLVLLLLTHSEAQVRLNALERCQAHAIQDPEDVLGTGLQQLLSSPIPAESEAAAHTLFSTHRNSHAFVDRVYPALVTDPILLRVVHDDVYMSSVGAEDKYKHTRATTHAILAILATDRLSVTRRVKTMFGALPWAEIKPYLLALIPSLHAQALVEAVSFLSSSRQSTGWSYEEKASWKRESDMEDLRQTEASFRMAPDERTRRLGLAILVGLSGEAGWGNEAGERASDRAAVAAYRADESVLVAEAAWELRFCENDDGDDEGCV